MKLFQIDNFEPVPTDEFFMIEEFKELYTVKYNQTEDDKSGKLRKRGLAEARYIYFLCDHRSEFAKYSADERHQESLDSAGLPPDYKISAKLEAAIAKYTKLLDSRNLRLLRGANAAVDKLANYLNDVDFTKADANGKPLYDPKDLISNISNLGKVIEGLEKLEEQVLKEEGSESTTRGSAEKGRLE
jgi:hypothetical protein